MSAVATVCPPIPALSSVLVPIIADAARALGRPASEFIASGALIAIASGYPGTPVVDIRHQQTSALSAQDLDLLRMASFEARNAAQKWAGDIRATVGAALFTASVPEIRGDQSPACQSGGLPPIPDLRNGISTACWGAQTVRWGEIRRMSASFTLVPTEGPGAAEGGVFINVTGLRPDGAELADWGDAYARVCRYLRAMAADVRAALAPLVAEAHRPCFTWHIEPPSAHQRMAVMGAELPR